MCDFRVWHQSDDNVYVLQCIDCNLYQVRLRNAAFMFEPFAYNLFRETVNEIYTGMKNSKELFPAIIPIINTEMEVMMNESGLRELYHLLDSADTEMKAAEMVRMF